MIYGDPRWLAPFFDVLETVVAPPAIPAIPQIIGDNPARVAICFVSTAANSRIATRAATLSTGGILLVSSQPGLWLPFNLYGGIVQRAWFAAGTFPGTTFTIIESIYRPDRG